MDKTIEEIKLFAEQMEKYYSVGDKESCKEEIIKLGNYIEYEKKFNNLIKE